MSGIVGIVNLDGTEVNRDLLWQMTKFMTPRGPDAQQILSDGPVGLGHTMLRTTFESNSETQPLTIDGKTWLIADARIDGRDELIKKLEAKLGSPASLLSDNSEARDKVPLTDALLILYAYKVWGTDCVSHLIGDFAFAIWDSVERRLFFARDHFGVKPFYYARVNNFLLFSNMLNCLRQHPSVSSKLNTIFRRRSLQTYFDCRLRTLLSAILMAVFGCINIGRYLPAMRFATSRAVTTSITSRN
jgi:asparagine synthase (glutamine-hydrolysing)